MCETDARAFRLGIVGSGAMGSGIAYVAATNGIETWLFDARYGAAQEARDGLDKRLAKRVTHDKMTEQDRASAMDRVRVATQLDELAGCNVVVEAIVEDLAVKRDVFSHLEEVVDPGAILASNTSSLPIGAIAAGMAHPERMAGLHFFNPVPVMRLVEVISGPDTTDAVAERLVALSECLGRQPVRVKDTPGFLVNFGGRAYTTEALAIVHEAVAAPAQIDAVMRECCGFRMGPFELMDLTGIDVNFPVTRFVYESFFDDPRLRSTPLHRYMLQTGQLGRKVGRGFYDYGGNRASSADALSDAAPARRVVLVEPDAVLQQLAGEAGVEVLERDDGDAVLMAAPVGEDCATLCSRVGLDPRRLVAVDTIPDTDKRLTLMTPPGADPAIRAAAIATLSRVRLVTAIADSPGFIAQRILGMVSNLGCEMAQIGLAKPRDIDLAMRLGLNYPKGPLELADDIGVETVFTIMTRLQALTGDDRYRPSAWLRRRAQLRLPATAV